MEEKSEITTLLERIAVALERIADSLTVKSEITTEPDLADKLTPSNSSELVESEPVGNDITKLQVFLASHGITIKTIPPEQESDETSR